VSVVSANIPMWNQLIIHAQAAGVTDLMAMQNTPMSLRTVALDPLLGVPGNDKADIPDLQQRQLPIHQLLMLRHNFLMAPTLEQEMRN